MLPDKQSLQALQATAELAARAAGAVALEGFRGVLEVTSKGGTDIVTQYDHAAEEAALGILQDRYPDHMYLAEESGETGAAAGHDLVWMVDPIDGTHNYASQIPFWCISIAVASRESEHPLVGVIYDPLHDELFSACKGGGARLNGQPIQVSTRSEIRHASVAYDVGYNPEISAHMIEIVAWVQPRVGKVRHLGSAALSLTYVAAGRLDAYYHLSLQPWDIAAALLLIEEAGGIVTDWHGTARLAGKGSTVASGAALHPAILELLRGSSAL